MTSRDRSQRVVVGLAVGGLSVLIVSVALAPFRDHVTRATPALLLVLPVMAAAVLGGRWAAVPIAVVACAAFSVGFIPPVGTLRVQFPEDIVALVVFLIVAVMAGTLVARESERRRVAEQRRAEIERMHEEYRHLMEERTHLAAEARRAELLEQVDHQRTALLRSVSHDLRTPLSTIRAVASDLRQDPGYDEASRDDLLDLIGDEAERLDRIVANVLSLSRIEAGAFDPATVAVDLAELIEHTAHRLRRLFGDHELRLDVPPDLPLVMADYTQIDQVVTNLLENSARHTPSGTVVTVTATPQDGYVAVTIADNGPGIDAAIRTSLFAPFLSGHRATTGIGLAICAAVVEAHGGTIAGGDSPGGGAWFRFTLRAQR